MTKRIIFFVLAWELRWAGNVHDCSRNSMSQPQQETHACECRHSTGKARQVCDSKLSRSCNDVQCCGTKLMRIAAPLHTKIIPLCSAPSDMLNPGLPWLYSCKIHVCQILATAVSLLVYVLSHSYLKQQLAHKQCGILVHFIRITLQRPTSPST